MAAKEARADVAAVPTPRTPEQQAHYEWTTIRNAWIASGYFAKDGKRFIMTGYAEGEALPNLPARPC